MSERPTLICFAGDEWDGNPHSRHHVMRRLSRDWEVLWIEGVAMRSVAPARGEAGRVLRKLRAGSGLRTVAPGLHVLRPPPLPPAGRLGRRLQLALLARSVGRARSRLGLGDGAIAWFSLPVAAPLLGRLGERGAIFYYQDRYHEFSHVDGGHLRDCLAKLAREADVTVATSAALLADLDELGASPVLVPHGVDLERFAATGSPEPADLAEFERPLVGYVGLIDDYLAFDHFLAVAERLERGTLVTIGRANTDVGALEHPRIRMLGQRPHDAIPAYLQAFSCCLVPFRPGPLSEAVNPIKLREYLAAGRPVVSTDMPEVRPYAEVVRIASGAEGFAQAVVDTVQADVDDPGEVERRRARVANESWDAVAERLDELMRPLLER